jgi:iron complex outermembrane recepter protein
VFFRPSDKMIGNIYHTGFNKQTITRWIIRIIPALTLFLTVYQAHAQSTKDLKNLTLEELTDVEVALVSKIPEKLSVTPSAIQVVTGEFIRRSSATRLPEVLELAFNLQAAQSSSHGWAITARGFNGAPLTGTSLANKLLVMIDGRSIYTPLFGGVFWDVQNVLLDDIDKIEVVSGPGGTLWGANAVNGVINIVRKPASETQGIYITGSAGTLFQDHLGFRYGGKIGDDLFYRAYFQRMDYNNTFLEGDADATDDWKMNQGGFRFDYHPSLKDRVIFQGDFYRGSENGLDSTLMDGQNFLAKWDHRINENSGFSLQMYFDRTWRNRPQTTFHDELYTYDIDFQHSFMIGQRNRILVGAGYRFMQDRINNTPTLIFEPADLDFDFLNLFVQDEVGLIQNRLKLSLGMKLSDNYYSGIGFQPGIRLSWIPNEQSTFWTATSHALRSASRFDADVVIPILGKNDFNWEKITAYEAGFRLMPSRALKISVAAYYNRYDNLRSINLINSMFAFENDLKANSWGTEISATLQLNDWWKIRGGYTYLHKTFEQKSGAVIEGNEHFEGLDPDHQVKFHSMMDLPANLSLDLFARYIDDLPSAILMENIEVTPKVPDYFTVDVRLAWQFKEFTVSVNGRELISKSHAEFGNLKIPRNVYGTVTWRL